MERPKLTRNLNSDLFRQFYYLKEELADFCRANGLPATGSKIELTERIAYFLNTGSLLKTEHTKSTVRTTVGEITEASVIEDNFVCSEKHREFFVNRIGKSFSFNVAFQKWLKSNTGKTYSQAIDAYYQILEDKKKNKTVIDKQFEYNTYIRDFFADNNGASLEDAIKCWKYKKRQQGSNRYEKEDILKGLNC